MSLIKSAVGRADAVCGQGMERLERLWEEARPI